MSWFDIWLDRLAKLACIGSFVAQFVFGFLALKTAPTTPSSAVADHQVNWYFVAWMATTLASGILVFFAFRKGSSSPVEEKPEEKPEPNNSAPQGAEGYANSLLRNQSFEIAKSRLAELTDDAVMLVRLVPKQGANERTAAHIWNAFHGKWRADVIHLLEQHHGVGVVADFADADGFNPNEPVGSVLDDSANPYRELLHEQRNLKNIKRTLG